MNRTTVIVLMALFTSVACNSNIVKVEQALESAGINRAELEYVLVHHSQTDPVRDKLDAALFLIENMPAHYLYAGCTINYFYKIAADILSDTYLTPEIQRDSLLFMPQTQSSHLERNTVPDTKIITKDFLIHKKDLSSKICIPVEKHVRGKLKDWYVYIASAIRTGQDHSLAKNGPERDGWKIVDFDLLRCGWIFFENIITMKNTHGIIETIVSSVFLVVLSLCYVPRMYMSFLLRDAVENGLQFEQVPDYSRYSEYSDRDLFNLAVAKYLIPDMPFPCVIIYQK